MMIRWEINCLEVFNGQRAPCPLPLQANSGRFPGPPLAGVIMMTAISEELCSSRGGVCQVYVYMWIGMLPLFRLF